MCCCSRFKIADSLEDVSSKIPDARAALYMMGDNLLACETIRSGVVAEALATIPLTKGACKMHEPGRF